MNISITDAKAQLTELVRRAEGGEVIVLTRHGRPAARIVPDTQAEPRKLDRAAIDELTRLAVLEATDGPDIDDLYDELGLPK